MISSRVFITKNPHDTIGSSIGSLVSRDDFERNAPGWIPSEGDRAFVMSLMQRVMEPGKMAGWIAPPDRGINNLPVDYEYVRLN